MDKDLRFSMVLFIEEDPRNVVEYVKTAEKAGFDGVWFCDHYFQRNVYSTLALAALNTHKIFLGTHVTGVHMRHPALIASSAATIDELSGGRSVLGLSSGGWEYKTNLCIDQRRPITACRDAIKIIRALWKGEAVDYKGEIFNLKNAELSFKPSTDIPIYLGARGPKMFQLVGELCDGSTTHGLAPKYVDYMLKQIRTGTKRTGRRMDEIDIVVNGPNIITDDIAAVKEILKPTAASFLGSEYTAELVDLLGFSIEEAKSLREETRMRGRKAVCSKIQITGEMLERIVDGFCIVGSVEEVIDRIEELRRAGVTHIATSQYYKPEKIKEHIETFGKKIVQSFKD